MFEIDSGSAAVPSATPFTAPACEDHATTGSTDWVSAYVPGATFVKEKTPSPSVWTDWVTVFPLASVSDRVTHTPTIGWPLTVVIVPERPAGAVPPGGGGGGVGAGG